MDSAAIQREATAVKPIADTDDFFVDGSVAVENSCDVKNVTGVVFEVARLIGVDDRTLAIR